jgi:mannose-6-phosphate isomerase-like protein (cupin superfamily)
VSAAPVQWMSFELETLLAAQRTADEPWTEFLRLPALRAGLYVLPPGAWDHQTPHEEDEMYYVIAGKATFQAGTESCAVGAGTILYVAAHQEHRFTEITEELRVLVCFAAPRQPGA